MIVLVFSFFDSLVPVSDCLLYPPTEMTDVHPFIRQWISCIRYFTIKYAPFTSILLYQILLFIDTHQSILVIFLSFIDLPIQKLTILHQYLYLLCTNQYISTILKTYVFPLQLSTPHPRMIQFQPIKTRPFKKRRKMIG